MKVSDSPYDVANAAGAAWVTDFTDGSVSRVDARTNKRTVIATGDQPAGIAAVGGFAIAQVQLSAIDAAPGARVCA